MRIRSVVFGLLTLSLWVAGEATIANGPKPTVKISLGSTPEQVERGFTFPIPWLLVPLGERRLRSGFTLVNKPHRLVYEDATLHLVLPDAGNRVSMPTGISVFRDAVDSVSASVLGEYANLEETIRVSRMLLAEVQGQGFDYYPVGPSKGMFSRFYLAGKNTRATPRPPQTVESFEEMEQVFLNSRFYLEEFVVFEMEKDGLKVSLRVTNMRRRFTENRWSATYTKPSIEARIERELGELDRTFLQNERAYYLEVSIARPGWMYDRLLGTPTHERRQVDPPVDAESSEGLRPPG